MSNSVPRDQEYPRSNNHQENRIIPRRRGFSQRDEITGWYKDTYQEVLFGPATEAELSEIRLFFCPLDRDETVALAGLCRMLGIRRQEKCERDEELTPDDDLCYVFERILPSVVAATFYRGETDRFVAGNMHLRRLVLKRGGMLRSEVPKDEEWSMSKGVIYTGDEDEWPVRLEDVSPGDVALLTAHELLIRRIRDIAPPARVSAVPYEYSRMERYLRRNKQQFNSITEAQDFVAGQVNEGAEVSGVDEVFQQGLLSILQTVSMFPDIRAQYHAGNRDAFCAMVQKIACKWRSVGIHGPLAQNDYVFRAGILEYSDGEVVMSEGLTMALDSLPKWHGVDGHREEHATPLHVSSSSTVFFRPTELPDDSTEPGMITGYLDINASAPVPTPTKTCPVSARGSNQHSLIEEITGVYYDFAKSLESNSSTPSLLSRVNCINAEDIYRLSRGLDIAAFIEPHEREAYGSAAADAENPDNTYARDELIHEFVIPALGRAGHEAYRALARTYLKVTSHPC